MVRDMMGDDFFSSPFRGRLTVSKSRPVVAEVNVDSTEVLAVPAKGCLLYTSDAADDSDS